MNQGSLSSRHDYPLIADRIKSILCVEDVLRFYGLPTSTHRRIPCPIHRGKDRNFTYKDRHWKCFVCGAGGTIIDLAMALFDLSFVAAVERLNADFRLGLLDARPDPAAVRAWQEQRRREEAETEAYRAELTRITAWHRRLWLAKAAKAPRTPEDLDQLDEEFVEACHMLPHIDHYLNTHHWR